MHLVHFDGNVSQKKYVLWLTMKVLKLGSGSQRLSGSEFHRKHRKEHKHYQRVVAFSHV